MRVSIYSYNYAPEPTGIPVYNTGMASWLCRRRGWQVTMHTGIPHYPWWQVPPAYAARDYRHGRGDEVIDGVEVQRVRHYVPRPPPGGFARMRLDASWLWQVWRRSLSQRRRPHAIVVVSPPFLGGLLGLLLRFRLRAPVVYHVQDLQVDAALRLGMLPPTLTRVLRWLERFVLERVDLVSTISGEMRRRLQGKARTLRPVVLFPNWADTSAVRPWQGDNRFRRDWAVAEGQPVVMYSGNLGQKQGVALLLEAVVRCRHDLLLVVAGEGPERAQLETHAKTLGLRRVRFIGLAAKERLSEFLSAADLHCIPQRREAAGLVMPSKLLNIMAVARAVVVTADPGTDLALAIDEAGCGQVAAPDDAPALAAAIDRLLGDGEARQRQGRAGRDHVERTLGIDGVVGRFADPLEQLVRTTTTARGRV